MRPILHGDVSSAARALLAVPVNFRKALCDRMILDAERADTHMRRSGRPHPVLGNGSLMSSARKRLLASEPGFDDIDYCQCFELVLQALINRRVNQQRS